MKISYTAKNYNISDKFKEVLERKLNKLEKYFDNDVTVKVNCIEQAKTQKLELTINSRGMFLEAKLQVITCITTLIWHFQNWKQIIKQGSKFKSKLKRCLLNKRTNVFRYAWTRRS